MPLILIKLVSTAKWPLVALIAYSVRFDGGFTLSLYYLSVLLLTFIVFLPCTQSTIKKKFGVRCFRYLGWNPGNVGIGNGRMFAAVGTGLVGVGTLDATLSLGINQVENAFGERQHAKNVTNYERHLDQYPDSKLKHPGPYVHKKPTSLLKRAVTSMVLISESKPKVEPKKHPTWAGEWPKQKKD